MRERKKWLSGVLALILGVSLLSGCGGSSSIDPEEVIDTAIDELKKVDSTTTEQKMIMDMTMKTGRQKLAFLIGADLTIEQVMDEMESHVTGTMKVETIGMDEDAEIEMYGIEDDGEYTTYTSTDGGSWESKTLDEPIVYNSPKTLKALKKAKKLEHDGSGTVEKQDTIKLKGKVKFEDIASSMGSLNDATDTDNLFGGIDGMEDMEVVVEAQFYEKTGLPASFKMDLTDAFSKLVEDMDEDDLGFDGEFIVDEFVVSYTYVGYDEVDEIEVPDDLEEDDDDYITGVDDPSGPWDSFKFTYEGKEYQMPMAYKDLEAAGLKIDSSSDSSKELDPEDFEFGITAVNEAGQKVSIDFENDSDEKKKITDCKIIGISVDDYEAEGMNFELPGGVKLGMSEDELNKVYKEFSSIYNGSYLKMYYYESPDFGPSVKVTLDVETGKVSGIEISM